MLVPPLLRESPTFRRFWAGQTVSLIGDQVSLIALPLVAVLVLDANAAQMGYLVAAELMPNLLFSLHAGAWADRRARKRQTMIATDVGRALLIGSIPAAYAFDALTFPHMLVVAFLMGTLTVVFHVSYSAFYPALVPRERLVEGGSIMHGSRALRVAGPSIGGVLVQAISAPVTLVVDALVPRLRPLPQDRRRRGAGDRGAGEGPRRRGRALGLRQPDHPGGARRDCDDQLLQLRLRCALHPLRDDRARRRTRDARTRARRRRGRRHPRRRRHRPRHPPDRRRPRLRARVRPLSGAAAAHPARPRPAVGDPRLPVPRRVRLRLRPDDARHQRRCDRRRRRPRPAPLARLRRVHGGQLRRAPARRARRGRARQLARAARDAVDRSRRAARRALAPALADPRDAGAAGERRRRPIQAPSV